MMGKTEDGVGYQSGSDTSREAAEMLRPAALRMRIYEALRERPMANWQLRAHFGIRGQHPRMSPRLAELQGDYSIVDSGVRSVNPQTGRRQVVFRVTTAKEVEQWTRS